MGGVIEDFIRRHPGLPEAEAFDGFLEQERVRAWVGGDAARKERLRAEFGRAWKSFRQPGAPPSVQVTVKPEEPARKLDLLCASCRIVPVKPVGPFAFVFGEGAAGWLTAAGLALLLLALYGALRWV